MKTDKVIEQAAIENQLFSEISLNSIFCNKLIYRQ